MKNINKTIAIVLAMSFSSMGWSQQNSAPLVILESNDKTIEMDTVEYGDDDLEMFQTNIDGHIMTAMITETGDTLIMATLEDISITSLRTFKDEADYRKYMKFKRYAAIVYPYAKEAIRIFRETEHVTQTMSRRKRKKHIKKLQEELKTDFEAPLSKLTKLQGKILMKMIEKELDKNMFDLIRGVRGRLSAVYWHNASKLYSYDLKEGYNEGTYDILDAVLQDFDVSYRIEQDKLNEK